MTRRASLNPQESSALEASLKAYEDRTTHQFALLTIASLQGDSLEDYSIRVAETWALGHEGHDNGLLLLVSRDDRKIRIEVGRGLEGDIPDVIASRVIRQVMAPRFRAGEYAEGINRAFAALMDAAEGKTVSLSRSRTREWLWWIALFIIIFFAFWPRGPRRRRGRGGYNDFYYWGGGSGGYSGGGFSGGFSGGGGGFSGGGASGGW